jgi:Coenzyme PQQ synthesis protein D (PqqD)
MNESLPSAVAVPDSVLYQELEEEAVLLNMSNQQYFGLNDVGAQMWRSLAEAGNIADAEALLLKVYEIEPPTLRSDLETLVRDLLKAGLLTPADSSRK